MKSVARERVYASIPLMNKPTGILERGHDIHAGPARFTTAEFLRMAEVGAFDDMKVELVDGELDRITPPTNDHAARQAMVMIRLGAVCPVHLLRGGVGIDLGDDTVLACDLAVLREGIDGRRLLNRGDVILLVEIAETTTARDTGLKRLKYAQAGIARYWIVDGARSVVHIHADPVDGDYADVRTVRFGEPLPVPGTGATIVLS